MNDEELNKIPKMFINGVECPWDGEKFTIPLQETNINHFTILDGEMSLYPEDYVDKLRYAMACRDAELDTEESIASLYVSEEKEKGDSDGN